MSECVFCRIIGKDLPAVILYEDEKIIFFLDIEPVSLGHSLVITKEHHAMIYDVPDELLGYAMSKVKRFMGAIKRATKCDFVLQVIEGIEVDHFHVKMIPRFHNDAITPLPKVKYQDGEAIKIANSIKAEL